MLLQLNILKELKSQNSLIVGGAIIEIKQLNIYYLNANNGENKEENSIQN
jgi:hypothetical protein